jgi:FG-GAP-like repeat
MDVHRRSASVLVVVANVVCAGLVWASLGLADLVLRPAISRTSVPAVAASDARPQAVATSSTRLHGRVGVAPASMSTVSLAQQAYSMAAPVFLLDPAAAQARSVAVGDVSGDGRDDLVFLSLRATPNPADSRTDIYVAHQRDDGRLDAAFKIGESTNFLAYQLLIADLDRNGVGDIVTASVNGVMVFRSNADGTFTLSTTVVGDPARMVATDVDRDGYLDVLVDSSNTSATVIDAAAARGRGSHDGRCHRRRPG